MDDYESLDATGLAALVRQGKATPRELVDEALARIEARNPALNAVVFVAADEARRAAEGPLPDGPFKGAPFLIKDLHTPVTGWPMSNGSRFGGRPIMGEDDDYVARCRAAGLILIGKTNTPEYGIGGTTEGQALGTCRSPWNTDHSSGGSSGGAGAAVAARILPMAHATDGLGSIRIPAACCGLVGMKPTRERTPSWRRRLIVNANTIGHVVSRSVRDSAAMLDWTGAPRANTPFAQPPQARPYTEEITIKPGRLKIVWSAQTPSGVEVHPDVAHVLEETVAMLAGLGHDVFERAIAMDWRAFYRAINIAGAGDFAKNMRREIEDVGAEPAEGDLEPMTKAIWAAAKRVTAEEAYEAAATAKALCWSITEQWRDFDVFLCPVMITPPPEIGFLDPKTVAPKELNKRQGRVFGFTPPFNFTGQPSLSLPLGMSRTGLPIGMMFTGRYADEATLYRLAAQLEAHAPWADRRPAMLSAQAA
ncbi:MAG: amidase [Hydrogenophilaceae bacterium]|nr:amidase [Hydrogenophilaceae bacterium]